MLDRLRDKVPLVRAHAIAALERLQDPSDKEDPVCTEYIRMLQADNSNVVRKAVITHVGISKYTLRHVLARARDVKEDVRAHLYSCLGSKLEMRVLSIKQRIQLLSDGLKDRSGVVREACLDLLKAWYNQAKDPVAFLRAVDVENSDEEKVEAIMKALFQCGVDLPKPEVLEEMSPEQAFYWRMWLTDVHTRDKNSSTFEKNAPTLTEMCTRIVNGHSDEAVARYTRRQFLLMTQILDFSDESGRRTLLQLVRQLATSLEASDTLVNTSMKVIVKLLSGQDGELCSLSMELINDVLDPMEQADESGAAGGVARLAELEEKKQSLLKEERYVEVAEVDAELKSLKASDEQRETRWLRCLLIADELLQNINKANMALQGLTEMVVHPGIQHPNGVIRGAAVRVLSLLCLLDREEATKHIPVLLVHIASDQAPIKHVALQGLFDILMMYGVNVAGDEISNVMMVLTNFMDEDDSDLQTTAVEGLARMMFSGRITEPSLLSKLLVLYFNPATEELEKLRQCLAVFFPAYAFSSLMNQRVISDVFTGVIKTLLKAPRNSPLSQVLPLKVSQFMVYLTDPRSLMSGNNEVVIGEKSPHAIIAQTVVTEMNNGDSADAKTYGKILTTLHANTNDQATVKALRSALASAIKVVNDKALLKNLEKKSEELKAIDLNPEAEVAPLSPAESSLFSSPGKAARRKLGNHKNVVATEAIDSDSDDGADFGPEAEENTDIKMKEMTIKEEPKEEVVKMAVEEEVAEKAVEEEEVAPVVEEMVEEVPVAKTSSKKAVKAEPVEEPKAAAAEEEEEEEEEEAPAKEIKPSLTKAQLNKMKVAELREELEGRHLDTKGTKPILIERLWNVMNGITEEDDEADAVDDSPVVKKKSTRGKN